MTALFNRRLITSVHTRQYSLPFTINKAHFTQAKAICGRLREVARSPPELRDIAECKTLINGFSMINFARLNEQDVSMFLNACAKLHLSLPNTLLDHLLLRASEHVKNQSMTAQGLSSIFNSLSRLLPSEISDQSNIAICDSITDAEYLICTLSPWQGAVLVQALAKIQISDLPDSLINLMLQYLSTCALTRRGASMVLDAIARTDDLSFKASTRKAVKLFIENYPKLSGHHTEQELFVSMHALSKLHVRNEGFVQWWLGQIKISDFTNQALANLALAFARLNFKNHAKAFIEEFENKLRLNACKIEAQHVSLVLYAAVLIEESRSELFSDLFDLLAEEATLSMPSKVQIFTALVYLKQHGSLETALGNCSLMTLQTLHNAFSHSTALSFKTEVFDAQRFHSSRLHVDVETNLRSCVATHLSITSEVTIPPFFVDLVVSGHS